MLAAVRRALTAVRRAGRRGVGLAVLSYLPPVLVALSPLAPLTVVGLIARAVVVLALIRLLGAMRPEPLPPPPQVDAAGRRIAPPRHAVEPVGEADRSVRHALGRAGALLRPAIRLTGLHLLLILTAPLALIVLSGNRIGDLSPEHQVLFALPLVALGAAFFGVTGQRIALEGDPRVLVAAAHSLRVARTAYGPLLAINLLQPAVATAALLVVDPERPTGAAVAAGAGLFALSVLFQLVGTATATEIYLAGPRLDVPAEFGAPPTAD